MKIKLLLGSVGIVVILMLVSFTRIVNVQSTTTSAVTDSPLFNVRTNRATNNENNRENNRDITSNYIGKGLIIPSFPQRNNRTLLIQRIIQRIRTIDDESFKHFKIVIINQINRMHLLKDSTHLEMKIALHQIRNKQNLVGIFKNQKNNDITFVTPTCYSLTIYKWIPGCFLSEFIIILLRIISTLIDTIVDIQTALGIGNCGTYCCTIDHGCSFFPGS